MQEKMLPDGNFRERLEEVREKRGLSPADLARASGLTPTAISRYRSGVRSPSVDELLALATALDVKMEWLLCGKDPKPSGPGGPGNAPMHNPGLGATARVAKAAVLEKEAKEFREMAAKLRTDADELIVRAVTYEDWAASILEDDADEEDWD